MGRERGGSGLPPPGFGQGLKTFPVRLVLVSPPVRLELVRFPVKLCRSPVDSLLLVLLLNPQELVPTQNIITFIYKFWRFLILHFVVILSSDEPNSLVYIISNLWTILKITKFSKLLTTHFYNKYVHHFIDCWDICNICKSKLLYHRLQAYISFHCFLGLITHHNQPVSWTSVSWSGHCLVELVPQSEGGLVLPQAVALSPKSYDSFQHSLKNYHSKITEILILYSCDRIRYLFKQ